MSSGGLQQDGGCEQCGHATGGREGVSSADLEVEAHHRTRGRASGPIVRAAQFKDVMQAERYNWPADNEITMD